MNQAIAEAWQTTILMEATMHNRPGCISGLIKLFFLDWIFDALQGRFGFGKGCSCSGCGCGLILLLIFLILLVSIITGTDWTHLGLHTLLPVL